MSAWSPEDLRAIAASDDLHIAPLRDDGETYGSLTWIWSVVVEGGLYARAYNGLASRWHRAALRQKAGRIRAAGQTYDVAFEAVAGAVQDKIDAAYRDKYRASPYLAAMIAPRARAATVSIAPRREG